MVMTNSSSSVPHANYEQKAHQICHHRQRSFSGDGILLVDKPGGLTSHDVVEKVRRFLGTRKIGHSGTLDPLASGLMVLLINQGTKLSPYLLGDKKTYQASIRLGICTDTWDSDGQILKKEKTDHLSCERIKQVIEKFIGTQEFKVPAYSAVKFKGRKLYDYARQNAKDGKTSVPEIHRLMSFDQVQIIELSPSYFKASLRASKGSFVRSWAYTIGEHLGVGAMVDHLKRMASGPYNIKQATGLDVLKVWSERWVRPEKLVQSEKLALYKKPELENPPGFIPLEETLQDWPEYVVRGRWEKNVKNGYIPEGMQWDIKKLLAKDSRTLGVRVRSVKTGSLLVLLKSGLTKTGIKVACVFNERRDKQ